MLASRVRAETRTSRTPGGAICDDVSIETFGAGPPAGLALAGWNFSVHARRGGLTELRTETRVWCAPDAWPRFGPTSSSSGRAAG